MLKTIRDYCDAVQNDRTVFDVFKHADEEFLELRVELDLFQRGEPAGADGVIGEAVDTILCMVDLIHQFKPDITNIEIMDIVIRKCEKWQRVYGKAE